MAKYQRIYQDIKLAIETGQLQKGDKLPSMRQLTQDYSCNKDTVQRALLELKHDHLIYSRARSGYYVLASQDEADEEIDLKIEGSSNPSYEDFRLCMNEALAGREDYLFNYYKSEQGLDDLLQSLQVYFEADDIYTNPDKIVVTSGTQQALFILSQMAFPNQKTTILLEQPTYRRMNRLVKELNLPYETIHRGYDGIDLVALEAIFKSKPIKFFYTISRRSNPLGLSYSQKEKEKIVELANHYDVYILEDDYMGDFCPKSDPPLHYYDIHDKVIYLKSFSMTLFPALRLGTVILPLSLKDSFLRYKTMIDYDTSLIMQKALSLYLNNGMFAKNTHFLKEQLASQRQEFLERLGKMQLPFIYHLSGRQLTLELPSTAKFGPLLNQKPYNQLDAAYIEENTHDYVAIPMDAALEFHVKQITQRLEGKDKT